MIEELCYELKPYFCLVFSLSALVEAFSPGVYPENRAILFLCGIVLTTASLVIIRWRVRYRTRKLDRRSNRI